MKSRIGHRNIFPVKMMTLLKTRKYEHIFDLFDPSREGNFGNKEQWNTEYRNFGILAKDCPRGGIVFHRPKDFLDELWCDGMDLNEAERENAFLSLVRQLNLYKFVYCSRKGTAPRKRCFLSTNESVYYAHPYFLPILTEEELTRVMISKKHDSSVSISSSDLSDIDYKIEQVVSFQNQRPMKAAASKPNAKSRKLAHKTSSSDGAEMISSSHLTLTQADVSESISSSPLGDTCLKQSTPSQHGPEEVVDRIEPNRVESLDKENACTPCNVGNANKVTAMPSIKRERNAIPRTVYHRKPKVPMSDFGGNLEQPKSPFSELDVNQSIVPSLGINESIGSSFLEKETSMNQFVPDSNDYAQMLLSPSTSVVRRQLHKSPNQTTTSSNNDEYRNRMFSPGSEFLENYSFHDDPLKGFFGVLQSPSTTQQRADANYREQIFDSPMLPGDLTSPTLNRFRQLHGLSPSL
eukprot:gb/GECG01015721.1/.p1 GENE.gb/GECG01015721.1/~~gb/GECG01015721.1/.p1  ORF type:complete len:464 (+),score=62.06 gb/GECG01015721.1/:1-1392(+)